MRENRLTIPLRWRDMDMLGHLNQAVYHELLEEARGALIQGILESTGGGLHQTFVVVRVELDYRREVRKDHGSVDVVARVEKVGTSSIVIAHEVIRADGVLAAEGSTVLVGWDGRARGKRELNAAERELLGVA